MNPNECRVFLRVQTNEQLQKTLKIIFPPSFKRHAFRIKVADSGVLSFIVLLSFDEDEADRQKDTFNEATLQQAFTPKDDEPPFVLLIPFLWGNELYNGRVEFTHDRAGERVCV